jgi:glycosyltransferase involved in cell wall biosynthesis
MKERIAADYGCLPEKISVIPNGVDAQVFHPNDSTPPTVDVISIGSFIHPRKGFHYLLETYRELSRRGKSIADVGRRSDEQRKALLAIPGVTICGTLSQEALLARMQSAAVLISTSLFEGFGLSLIEALSCGRPAFAFGVGAVPEVLEPIDPSLIVPPRDVQAMVNAACAYLDLPAAEQQHRGLAYCAAVQKYWSMESATAALRSLYMRLENKRVA